MRNKYRIYCFYVAPSSSPLQPHGQLRKPTRYRLLCLEIIRPRLASGGMIHVLEGELGDWITDPRRAKSEEVLTAETAPGVVELTIPHAVRRAPWFAYRPVSPGTHLMKGGGEATPQDHCFGQLDVLWAGLSLGVAFLGHTVKSPSAITDLAGRPLGRPTPSASTITPNWRCWGSSWSWTIGQGVARDGI